MNSLELVTEALKLQKREEVKGDWFWFFNYLGRTIADECSLYIQIRNEITGDFLVDKRIKSKLKSVEMDGTIEKGTLTLVFDEEESIKIKYDVFAEKDMRDISETVLDDNDTRLNYRFYTGNLYYKIFFTEKNEQ